MRVLRVLAPGADPDLVQYVHDGVDSFNRGLDIRLRFLSIVIEHSELRLTDAESAAEVVGAEIAAVQASIVLVHGDGPAALAAATVAARGDALVAHMGAGVRSGSDADTARAIDHVCGLLLAVGADAAAALEDEGLEERTRPLEAGADLGHQVIKALRAERLRRRGDATC